MGLGDSLKDTYYSLEDKWYAFVDNVSEKVPAFGKGIDALEEKGIPSFPLAIVIVVLLIIGLLFLFFGAASSPLTVNVIDSSSAAIGGATVTVFAGVNPVAAQETTDTGNVTFSLNSGTYTIKVEKEGYATATQDASTGTDPVVVTLTSGALATSKPVYMKTASGQIVNGSGTVRYYCRGNPDDIKTAFYTDGKFDAEFSQECTDIVIDSVSGYRIVNGTASFSGGSVTVEQDVVVTGSVRINLSAANGTTIPPGLRVVLSSTDGTYQQYKLTETSVVAFDNVPTKAYYVTVFDTRTDAGTKFNAYDGKTLGNIEDVNDGQTTEFNVTLQETISAKITVTVRNVENSAPLSGATVDLMLASSNTKAASKVTGSTGQVVFDVADGQSYVISAQHPDYLIGTTDATRTVASTEQTVDLFLVKATAENSQSLVVTVTDTKGDLVDNAKVVLKKLDETVIDEKTTGADGLASFYNLDLGQYYAFVAKDSFASTNSASVQVLPRQQANLTVRLDIGSGTIDIKVLDKENSPLQGATVKMINYYTQKQEAQKSADSQGLAEFSVRGDKSVYFVVSYSGMLNYTTAIVKPDIDSTVEKNIVMVKPTGQLTATLRPVQSGSATVADGTAKATVSAGVYTITAVVAVPKGTFSEAGLMLMTGKNADGTTNTIDEDNAKITSATSAATKTVKGTTFTPPNGYDTDSKNLTQNDAKWVTFSWKNPAEGVYEAEIELTVSEVNPNQPVNVWYKGWAKGASTLRDPAGASVSNDLYATAKNYIMTSGAANLCTNGICNAYTLQVLSGSEAGRKIYIGNSFTAKKGTTYELTADITNNSGKPITGAVLSIDTVGLDVNNISVNSVDAPAKQVNLGTVSVDGYFQVKTLFTVKSSGTDTVKLKLDSATQNVLNQTVTLTVPQNKTFTLDIIPKEIVPYITNSFFFTATDGNTPLEGVLIEVKNGETVLGTTETTSEGVAQFEVASPSVGDTLTITASKEGYDTQVITKDVDESILLVTPPEINETIKIGEVKSIDQTVLIENATPAKATITSVDFTGALKSYLDIKFTDTIAGTTIDSGKDKNYNLNIKLNSSASTLKEPKEVVGDIVFNTTIVGTNQTFESSIPVDIRLSMPGYIDSGKCLKVTPTSIDLIAGGSEATATIELENTCTAESIPVNLYNLQAKLNTASKLGSVSVAGEGFSGTLSDTFTKIGDLLAKDTKVSLTVRFIPNGSVASGTESLTIMFQGENIPETDVTESVTASTAANISMSNLAKCVTVETPENGIVLDVAGFNLGYNRLAGTNLNAQLGAYAQQYQGFSQGGNASMPFGYQSQLPFMSGAQYGVGQQQAPNSSIQQSSFVIKNNCAVDVDIDLDPDARVNVGTEKFTIAKDGDSTVIVTPGYTLGKYKIVVNAKPANSSDTKKNISSVDVLVRKLGDIDRDCIKVNTATINLNSFIYSAARYKVYNYCYDSGVQLARAGNAVTVQCNSPSAILNPVLGGQLSPVGAGAPPFLQVGMESLYASQFPLNSAYGSYNQYVQTPGCGGNQCELVTGTRVYQQNLLQGEKGTTEELTFEVTPNASYLPQRRLFNNNTGQYGLFQSLGDIRAWLTETDARTNIYGNINVQYSNQYGSTQCMSFPVQIKDSWRTLESVDSAINWGDPNARPSDCVSGNDQKVKALDIYGYWIENGTTKGAIPDSEYTNSGTYLFVPSVPAVRIGPAPNNAFSGYYPSGSYAPTGAITVGSGSSSGSASKNCGLLDQISDLQYENQFGGVTLSVETTTQGGSILNNTKGPNLMVSINRTNITANCVYINTTVRGKITRAVNIQSEEVTWKLRAVVAKPGYPVQSTDEAGLEKECLTTNTTLDAPTCQNIIANEVNTQLAKVGGDRTKVSGADICNAISSKYASCDRYCNPSTVLNTTASTAAGCTTAPAKYGFELIKETNPANVVSYESICTDGFCNADMLNVFLKKRAQEITDTATATGTDYCTSTKSEGTLSKLYKEAGTVAIPQITGPALNFYASDDGLVATPYVFPTDKDTTTRIDSVKKQANSSTADMLILLNKISAKDAARTLVRFDAEGIPQNILDGQCLGVSSRVADGTSPVNVAVLDNYAALGLNKAGDKYYYMPLSYYKLLNTTITSNQAAFASGTNVCLLNYPAIGEITKEYAQWMANAHPTIVFGVTDTLADSNALEAAQVYEQNYKLKEIRRLAVFDSKSGITNASNELYLTTIANLSTPASGFNDIIKKNGLDAYAAYPINLLLKEVVAGTIPVGKYKATIDMNLCSTATDKTIILNLTPAEFKDAPNAKDNVLLTSGFNLTTDSTSIVDSSTGILVAPVIGSTSISGPEATPADTTSTATLFSRTPVKINADISGGESAINYRTFKDVGGTAGSLITWHDGATTISDTKVGSGYTVKLPNSTNARTVTGVYYYTDGNPLTFTANNFGGKITGTIVGGVPASLNIASFAIPSNPAQSPGTLEVTNTTPLTINDVKKLVTEGTACIAPDGKSISWNETALLK